MTRALACALALIVALQTASASAPTGKPEEVGLSTERLQRITRMLQQRITKGDLVGAVAIVARKGKVVHHEAHGVMDLESKKPMTPASMFRIASMTKPIVTVAIMMLVEEGHLRLNDPVARYIPEFRNMKVAVPTRGDGEGSAPPRFYTVPAERELTIKDCSPTSAASAAGR
jgi:CubicO group peptidase (beta-lactamase class C family)